MQVELGTSLLGFTPIFAAETAAKAAATAAGPDLGLFDVLLIMVFLLGCWRGKARGISEELLVFMQWLSIIAAASFLYGPVGNVLVGGGVPRLWANMGGYVLMMIAVSVIFAVISKKVGKKLVDSDFFGDWEYRLGIVAGAIRFLCVWLTLLALLHARHFNESEIIADRKFQEKEVGVVLIPSWGMLNRMAFYNSYTGPYIRQHLSQQLITPVGLSQSAPNPNTIGKQQQRVLDDVSAPKSPSPPPPQKK